MKKRTDIFYDEIIPEAATGYIDCDFFIPICFGTRELVDNKLVTLTTSRDFEGAMIPTLIIKDRDKLNNSIDRYLSLAEFFYRDDPRLSDVKNKDKYMIASLLSNTLVTDFNDISSLFERHSDFLQDDSLNEFLESKCIGYSSILKSNIFVSIDKQSIVEESPYGFNIWLGDNEDNIIYKFPTIRFGISENKAYIYAVQSNNTNDNKKIERILRKTGEGFDEKNADRDPINNPENLYSVSPWSLVALSVFLPIIKNCCNVNEFLAPYFLVNRWNGVEISYEILKEQYKDRLNNPSIKAILDKKEVQVSNHDNNQRNITDKFIRNFRRLDHHFSNINTESFQLDMDSCLHFTVGDECECNNSLLGEVYNLTTNFAKQNTSNRRK